MKLPRDLSGRKLTGALTGEWGCRVVHQVGSHLILETESPTHQRIAVPGHKVLRIGTLNAILRAVSEHKRVSKQDILDTF